ncbi:MAG TPA: hypothetical protein VK538_07885 [Solirubrobacteraceae bacterium]|nr:hypothetical protein [Solirubrobacteraceae bacterium]
MSFDISRLRRAERIVGGGAIALFIFMFFFKWFGGSVSGALPGGNVSGASSSSTGWDTFTNSRWVWLITIIVSLGAVIAVAAARRIESPVQPSVVVTALGALSAVLIFYRIVHHPSGSVSFGGVHASYGIKIGIWLGLIAALAITYGGYLMMQAEGTSLADVRERAGGAFSGITAPGGGGPSGGSGAGTAAPGASSAEPAAPAAPSAPVAPEAPPPIPPPASPPGEAAGGGPVPPPAQAG